VASNHTKKLFTCRFERSQLFREDFSPRRPRSKDDDSVRSLGGKHLKQSESEILQRHRLNTCIRLAAEK
jgi:hypothetical protein